MTTLRERVEASLRRQFAPQDGRLLRLEGPLQWRLNSALFRASGAALPCPLAVKACFLPRTSAPDAAIARQQYAALERVHAKMGADPLLNVPRPVLCDDELGVVAVEWLEGATLTEHLAFGPGLRRASGLVAMSGRWLRSFHDAGPVDEGPFDFAHKEGEVRTYAQDAMCGDPAFRAGVEALAARLPEMRERPQRRSWVHGDFKCDNVFVCAGRFAGIDITLHLERNPVVYDAAQFLNHLALLVHAPTRPYLRPLGASMERAFVAGYASGGIALDTLSLAWVRLFMTLSLWRTDRLERPSGLRHWVVGRMMRRLAAQQSEALRRA